MTNVSANTTCEKCGGVLEFRRQGSTGGLFCTKCDWSVVTTYLPEILQDLTTYDVKVISGDYRNDQQLKVVAQVAGVNLLTARQLLKDTHGFVVFTGIASKVTEVRDMLTSGGLTFEITPSFPW